MGALRISVIHPDGALARMTYNGTISVGKAAGATTRYMAFPPRFLRLRRYIHGTNVNTPDLDLYGSTPEVDDVVAELNAAMTEFKTYSADLTGPGVNKVDIDYNHILPAVSCQKVIR